MIYVTLNNQIVKGLLMKIVKLRIMVLLAFIFLIGCASSVTSPFQEANILNKDQPQNGNLWVFWKSKDSGYKLKIMPANIWVDGKEVGSINMNGHGLLALKPGLRHIEIQINNSYPLPMLTSRKDFDFKIEVSANNPQTYVFAYQAPAQGLINLFAQNAISSERTGSGLENGVNQDMKKSNKDLVYIEK